MVTKDAQIYAEYAMAILYGKLNAIRLNRNVFQEMLKSASYLSQANALRDTIILLDEHKKGDIVASEYLGDLGYYTAEYYKHLFDSKVKYDKKDEINKGPNFHISHLVNIAYGSSPTKKLKKQIYYNSILSSYLISSVYAWDYIVYRSLDESKESKEFDWDVFKGDLQLELINKWNTLCKTKTPFNRFQKIDVEDIISGVEVENLTRCSVITRKRKISKQLKR